MNNPQLKASLLKAIEGMQEAVSALYEPEMRVDGDATCDAPISTLTSQEEPAVPLSDYVVRHSVKVGDENLYTEEQQEALLKQTAEEGISRAKAQMGYLWRVAYGDNRPAELVAKFTTGTVHNTVALAKLVNALIHWHGEMPDEDQLSAALHELSVCYPQGEWQNTDFDFRLFEGPAQAEFWNGDAYATPYAAEKDGAIYATDDKVHSVSTALTVATAVSEVWGHEYGQSIAISF